MSADLFAHYPLRSVTYPELTEIDAFSTDDADTLVAICAKPVRELVRRSGHGMWLCIGTFSDGSGEFSTTWFHMPYLREALRPDRRIILFGRIQPDGNHLYLQQLQLLIREQYEELLHRPASQYILPRGISEKTFGVLIEQTLSIAPPILDRLSPSLWERYGLLPEDTAVREIHVLRDTENFAAVRKCIIFNGFLRFLYVARRLKGTLRKEKSFYTFDARVSPIEFRWYLPFSPTAVQQKVCDDLRQDLALGTVMNCLVQGNVGSGKTVVAAAVLFTVCRTGCQGAFMVSTEVLARQHHETLCILFAKAEPFLRLDLLTGSTHIWEHRVFLERLKCGEIGLLIGARALPEGTVVLSALVLVVTGEQYCSGILQRERLAFKGQLSHILVMSATPILRTLAVILYEDLDNSVIDARPAGRNPTKNAIIKKEDRLKALLHIKWEIAAGHQTYIVCPQIELNPMTDLENVEEYSTVLRKGFHGEITVGALHERMKEAEKQTAMECFTCGGISVPVAMIVIEIGVDVPNAAVTIAENAERLGLAALHQLRGRVGRGRGQAYRIFVQGKRSKDGIERPPLLQRSNDGFETAVEDSKYRGPDELFGAAQNGELTFGFGNICNDHSVLQLVKETMNTLA